MEVIITDVTNMSPGQHCVAGFDVARNCMVRLLPNGRNWTTQLIDQVGVYEGVVLDVEPQQSLIIVRTLMPLKIPVFGQII